jgi:hypothetical protein
MIEALDESIKQFLVQKVPLSNSEVDISFDAPNREWSGSISKPTVNVYLHDIRENLDWRYANASVETNDHKHINRLKLSQTYDFSYLITAWTTNIEDEHRLLWYVLSTLIRYRVVPKEVLQAPWQDQPYDLHIKVARPDGVLRNAADVWTSLDNQLKPVISLAVMVTLEPFVLERLSPPITNRSLFMRDPVPDMAERVAASQDKEADLYSLLQESTIPATDGLLDIEGTISDSVDASRFIQAEVILVEQGLHVRADAQGHYVLKSVIPKPNYTFIIVAAGYVTSKQVIAHSDVSYDFKLQLETSGAVSR